MYIGVSICWWDVWLPVESTVSGKTESDRCVHVETDLFLGDPTQYLKCKILGLKTTTTTTTISLDCEMITPLVPRLIDQDLYNIGWLAAGNVYPARRGEERRCTLFKHQLTVLFPFHRKCRSQWRLGSRPGTMTISRIILFFFLFL